MGELKTNFYKALFWSFLSKILSYFVTFIISVVLARLLAPSEFGIVAMIWVIVVFAQIFIDTGLSSSLIQKQNVEDVHYGSVLFFNVFVGIILTLSFYFSAQLIADFYNNQDLVPIVKALSVTFFLSSLGRVQAAWLTKQMNFKKQTYFSLISQICGGVVGVCLAFNGYGVWSIVYQYLISSVISPICFYFFTGWRPKFIFSFKALKELWSFGFRMFLSGLLNSITSIIDEIIIGKIYSPANLGYYNRGKALTKIFVQFTSSSLMTVFFPALSKIQSDLQSFKVVVIKALKIISFISMPLIGFLFLLSEDIIILLFSEKWHMAVDFFQLIVIGYFSYPLSALLVNVLSSRGNSKAFLKLEIIKQSMLIVCIVIGFQFGIKEYLYGYIFIGFWGLFANIYFAAKEILEKIWTFIKIIGAYFMLTVFITVALCVVSSFFDFSYVIHALIFGSSFIVLYLALSYLLKLDGLTYSYREIKSLLNLKKNGKDNSN